MRPNPCAECKIENGRHPGCHAKCQKYIDWRKEYDDDMQKKNHQKAIRTGEIGKYYENYGNKK